MDAGVGVHGLWGGHLRKLHPIRSGAENIHGTGGCRLVCLDGHTVGKGIFPLLGFGLYIEGSGSAESGHGSKLLNHTYGSDGSHVFDGCLVITGQENT